jgi:hypothetical protein
MGRVESTVRVLITLVVGTIGAAVGFSHTHDWAEINGQTGWVAWAVAVVVECMAIVAALELRRKRGAFPLGVLIASFVLQMAAQVSSARPTPAGWLLAATPALGFLVIVKLVMRSAELAPPVTTPVDQRRSEPVAATSYRNDVPLLDQPERLEITPVPAAISWPPQ